MFKYQINFGSHHMKGITLESLLWQLSVHSDKQRCLIAWQPVFLRGFGWPLWEYHSDDGWLGNHHQGHLQPVFGFGFNASGLLRFSISKLHHLILKQLPITNPFYKH